MEDPDNSPHSSHGMLELTRDRLATLAAMVASLPAGWRPAALEQQPAPTWTDTRDDDGRWLTGATGCPEGCSHVLMTHRTDVGCVTCDCQHGIPDRPDLIDRDKSHVLPADLAEQYNPEP